ncbi:SAD/SRA domain [Teratosphaeria destructans]|uniref:SAD/SRA domain n=1 Tax=Teratosphaeria destructans TaxID=418781 RepID=A0A9W7SYM0_9PEZI|nr:SAD/SRA domain [Teratosphaeria destructans]
MGNEASKEDIARIDAETRAAIAEQTARFKKEAQIEQSNRIRAQQVSTNDASPDTARPAQPTSNLKRSSKSQAPADAPRRIGQQPSIPGGAKASAIRSNIKASDGSTATHETGGAVKEESVSEGEVDDSGDEEPIGSLVKRNRSAVVKQGAPAVQDSRPVSTLRHTPKTSHQPAVQASSRKKPQAPRVNTASTSSWGPAADTPTTASAKRSATSAFADERRDRLKQAKRADAASFDGGQRKKVKDNPKETIISIDERPPRWYKSLKWSDKREPSEASTAKLLEGLKADIKKTQEPAFFKDTNTAKQIFNNIRQRLHNVPFQPVSAQLLRNNWMLHEGTGLPVLFGEKYPWDIRADAQAQYNKWCLQEFETDLLHHIIRGVPKKGAAMGSFQDKVHPDYKKSAKFFGNGLLLNGQWWPTQMTVFRDGAHGETIKGISGSRVEGAYSCIMSGGTGYDNKNGDGNEDLGDVVLYCGMDSSTGAVTEETQMLMRNEEGGAAKPVRLIRSHQCPNKLYAPAIGFRYDGLYQVVSHERVDAEGSVRQRFRFKLVRVKGQDPIRGGTGPERRPTDQEIEAYKTDKRMRGYT